MATKRRDARQDFEKPISIAQLAKLYGKSRAWAFRRVQCLLIEKPPTPECPWAFRQGRSWRINQSAFRRAFTESAKYDSPDELQEAFWQTITASDTLERRIHSFAMAAKAGLDRVEDAFARRDKKRVAEIVKLRAELQELRSVVAKLSKR